MDYETWLNNINALKNGNLDNERLIKLQEAPLNGNINERIIPKLEEMIQNRFEIAVNKITQNLGDIFSDVNYLDLVLVNFKKELQYIEQVINLKQIPLEKQKDITKDITEKTNQIYEILLREANKIDQSGIYAMTIENNKMKWSK